MVRGSIPRHLLLISLLLLITPALLAQQTGSVSGKVTTSDGSGLPGVTVEARSPALPQPRVTVTGLNGEYRLPALQPGTYTLTFSLAGMGTVSRRVPVLLAQNAAVDVLMGVEALAETITVTADATLVDPESTEIKSALSNDEIQALPVGQEYRDLVKLAPGVMVTEDETRGPSAGGSGQDNVYQFDGVNVSLPQYGTLAAEPASHDIAQLSVVKGGAKATDFNRSAGFTIDSVSKSGTNEWIGQVGFTMLDSGMTSDLVGGQTSRFEEDRTWAQANIGGPVLRDRLFFYGSYYRPTRTRENRANLYGELPEYDSTRNEWFGKLTFTPTSSILINGSYRTSDRRDTSSLFGPEAAATTGEGVEIGQTIGILEGSWVINSRSFATFKFNDFEYLATSRPDFAADVNVSTSLGTQLDLNRLDQIGLLIVPVANSSDPAVNAFRQPFIDRFGYVQNGVRVGGGNVGLATTFDRDDFFRTSGEVGYNITLGRNITHDLHVGYQRFEDAEELERGTNGWGAISIIGGATNCPSSAACAGEPIFYQASFQQQSAGIPPINSEIRSENIEFNDTIHWRNWTFNAGVIASHDTYYGQGLEKADNFVGFRAAVGSRYEMYDIPFEKMIQPRLGATWAYNGSDTAFASYAIYNPVASSLPRAASWDRNLRQTIRAFFDVDGRLIGVEPVASSSGKLFVEDMKPRTVHEYLLGTSQQLTGRWSGRLYTRYRKTDHFWEDTNNNARVNFNPPPGIPRELYIPDLSERIAAIGSGSSYVIAELDGAFTKYIEATLESDWRSDRAFVKGTYTWSHYYGNFDQDGTTGCGSPPSAGAPCDDQNTFIGSSNIADGAGRQLWDNKYGDLHGDRRHILKVYGSYLLPWQGSVGAFAVYQSGQPWEAWDRNVYQPLVGTSTSDTIRYAEPAGSRRTPSHYQLDLNYTQGIPLTGNFNLEFLVDVFNVFDNQTERKYQPSLNSSQFGQPVLWYPPRRFQIAARVQF